MEVTRQNLDDLNAFLKVEIYNSDYNQSVKSQLEKIRKNAHQPGFRKGMLPFSLIQKQYGKTVLLEELNKLIDQSLTEFIQTNNLELISQPIPKENTMLEGDLDHPDIFSCEYQIALKPQVDFKNFIDNTYDYFSTFIDDKFIDEEIDDLRRKYGRIKPADQTSKDSIILGHLTELNEDNSITDGGVFIRTHLIIEYINDTVVQEKFIGKQFNDLVVFDARNVDSVKSVVFKDKELTLEEWNGVTRNFQFVIEEIHDLKRAELNVELFDKVYGQGEVSTEEELRERISNNFKKSIKPYQDRIFLKKIHQTAMSDIEVQLPEDFLRRNLNLYTSQSSQKNAAEEEYQQYLLSTKWDIIQTQLLKEYKEEVQDIELIEYAERSLIDQYTQEGKPIPSFDKLHQEITALLKDNSTGSNIFKNVLQQKVLTVLKRILTLNEIELPYEDFFKQYELEFGVNQ